jgi:hypothetical protein
MVWYALHSSVYAVLLVEECSILDTYHDCIYNRFPEDVPSGSEHVEDIKIKVFRKCAFRCFMLCNYITIHGAENVKLRYIAL